MSLGVSPPSSRLGGTMAGILHHRYAPAKDGGADRDQTDDLVVANDALYQLSYCPEREGRFCAITARE